MLKRPTSFYEVRLFILYVTHNIHSFKKTRWYNKNLVIIFLFENYILEEWKRWTYLRIKSFGWDWYSQL